MAEAAPVLSKRRNKSRHKKKKKQSAANVVTDASVDKESTSVSLNVELDEFCASNSDVAHLLFNQVLTGHYSLDVELLINRTTRPDADAEDTEQKPFSMKLHKCVLTTGSPVFDTMFSGKFSEATSNVVPIYDVNVNPNVFKEFVKFIYIREADLTEWDELLQGYYLAIKYLVPQFKSFCEEKIEKAISCPSTTTFDFEFLINCFEEADHLGPEGEAFIHKLAKRAFLAQDLKKFCENAVISDVSRKFMEFFLDLEGFDLINEIVFFRAANRWALAEARRQEIDAMDSKNIRSILDDLLLKIRFPLIPSKLLATEVAESGLLDEKELYEILLIKNGAKKEQSQYSSEPRFESGFGPGEKIKFKPPTSMGKLDRKFIKRAVKGSVEVRMDSRQEISEYYTRVRLKFDKDVEILAVEYNTDDVVWRSDDKYDIFMAISGFTKSVGSYHNGSLKRRITDGEVKFSDSLKLKTGNKLCISASRSKRKDAGIDEDDDDSHDAMLRRHLEEQVRHQLPKVTCFNSEVKFKVRGLQDPHIVMTVSTKLASLPFKSITVRELSKETAGDDVEMGVPSNVIRINDMMMAHMFLQNMGMIGHSDDSDGYFDGCMIDTDYYDSSDY